VAELALLKSLVLPVLISAQLNQGFWLVKTFFWMAETLTLIASLGQVIPLQEQHRLRGSAFFMGLAELFQFVYFYRISRD
jgi:hypothetical protein